MLAEKNILTNNEEWLQVAISVGAFSELCVFFIHKLDCKNEYLRKPFWAYLQKYFKKIFPVSDFSESGRD